MNTKKFIDKSNEIWNNLYDYSLSNYINSYTKIRIICKKHGEFEQFYNNHYRYGCAKCRKPSQRNELLKNEASENFSIKANFIHNNKYNYEKSKYVNAVIKVIVTCNIHGDFEITPNNHLRGRGCPACSRLNSNKSKIKPIHIYINKFKILFNDKYDYSNIEWNGGSKYIKLMCKKHGEFNILPYIHLKGKECPKCSCNYSKISIQWLEYLKIKYNIFIQHGDNIGEYYIPTTKYKADGYCKENNTVYEFLGDFWHGNPQIERFDLQKKNPKNNKTFKQLFEDTQNKKQAIINLGYKYIEIWEDDWKKFIKTVIKLQNFYKCNKLLKSFITR